jgi:hypothetical protein
MCILLAICGILFQAKEVRNEQHQFRFRVPAGYEEFTPKPPDVDYLWRRVLTDGSGQALAFTVQVFPGPVGREQGDPQKMQEATAKRRPQDVVTTRGVRWNDLDLVAIDLEHDSPRGGRMLSVSVTVPTAPRALLIQVMGPVGQKDLIRAEAQDILRSVSGKTNWIPSAQRGLLFAAGGTSLLGWTIWAAYGLVWVIAFRTHPERAVQARAICLSSVAVLILIGVCLSLVIDGLREDTKTAGPQVLGGLAAFAAAARAAKLWNLRPGSTRPAV